MILNEVDFSCIQFWIQVHRLELGVLNSANTRHTGEGIRKCFEMEESSDIVMRGFLRIIGF